MTRIEHRKVSCVLKRAVGVVGFVLLTGAGCTSPNGSPSAELQPGQAIENVELPEIMPPRIERRMPVKVDPKALPQGMRANFPAFDGDSFFITAPVTLSEGVNASDLLRSTLPQVLRAVGFTRGVGALSAPPEQGVPQPIADSKGLGAQVAYDYANNPKQSAELTANMIEAMVTGQGSPAIDAAMQVGEGMTFSQFVAGIERLEIKYPFQQIDLAIKTPVPIEHTQLVASRWDLQGVTTIYGNLFDQYAIVNNVKISSGDAYRITREAMIHVEGIDNKPDPRGRPLEGPFLVLFPYDTDPNGVAQLHYAYRLIVGGYSYDHLGDFLVWLDTDSGSILKMEPLFGPVNGKGKVYNRDPGVGTVTQSFTVNSSVAMQYTLQLTSKVNRVDFLGNGFDANDVSISDSMNGSSPVLANFDQAPINDPVQALCGAGTNKGFQQVNFYGSIIRDINYAIQLGIFLPFPPSAFNPKVESASAGCNAWSSMDYGACQGYFDAACPSFSGAHMNFAHDNSVIDHEFGHNVSPRMTNARPANWCCAPMPMCMPACAMPLGWGNFHDLADFLGDHVQGTNCTAGWVSKNIGGVDFSLNCAHHNEGGGLPRLHQVTTPFNPGAAGE